MDPPLEIIGKLKIYGLYLVAAGSSQEGLQLLNHSHRMNRRDNDTIGQSDAIREMVSTGNSPILRGKRVCGYSSMQGATLMSAYFV